MCFPYVCISWPPPDLLERVKNRQRKSSESHPDPQTPRPTRTSSKHTAWQGAISMSFACEPFTKLFTWRRCEATRAGLLMVASATIFMDRSGGKNARNSEIKANMQFINKASVYNVSISLIKCPCVQWLLYVNYKLKMVVNIPTWGLSWGCKWLEKQGYNKPL